ncbi:MAG: (2Fe-2S)-binding protein [Burkholderiales bacterium]|nr:(2Fe-2S)-binding protein [Burkholderiales bacterium]
MTGQRAITLTVNGRLHLAELEPRRTLADFLREQLDLTGTHLGCEHGACGACTVLLDGRPVCACLTLAVQADRRSVVTIEGLSPPDGSLTRLQESFRRHHALQCGFCTAGMIVTAHALLSENPRPSREAIRDAISGNLCRCTGYVPIVEAIYEAAQAGGPAVTTAK